VRDEEPAVETATHLRADLGERRRRRDHRIVDSREVDDRLRYPHSRVHEAAPRVNDLAVLEQHDSDLDDAVPRGRPAGRLEIDARDCAVEWRHHCGPVVAHVPDATGSAALLTPARGRPA
jgi:hypothetical protein